MAVAAPVTVPGPRVDGPRVRPVGRHALLVEVRDARQALDLATFARTAGVPAVEVVPAARTVLFDGVSDGDRVLAVLADWEPGSVASGGEVVEVPVVYDGEDLEFVAERWGTDVDGVVARHQSLELVSAFCGFAPGFAYLSGVPAELAVPRLDSPRPRVPAGSVALADTWCAVYPGPSPGGWRLIGRTEIALWDPDAPRPALLAPGTRVRFRAA